MNQPNYSMEHLENYIALMSHLTGETPKSIVLKPDVYTWYTQEVARLAEVFGLTKGWVDGKVLFRNVELIKKSEIAQTPTSASVPTVSAAWLTT